MSSSKSLKQQASNLSDKQLKKLIIDYSEKISKLKIKRDQTIERWDLGFDLAGYSMGAILSIVAIMSAVPAATTVGAAVNAAGAAAGATTKVKIAAAIAGFDQLLSNFDVDKSMYLADSKLSGTVQMQKIIDKGEDRLEILMNELKTRAKRTKKGFKGRNFRKK